MNYVLVDGCGIYNHTIAKVLGVVQRLLWSYTERQWCALTRIHASSINCTQIFVLERGGSEDEANQTYNRSDHLQSPRLLPLVPHHLIGRIHHCVWNKMLPHWDSHSLLTPPWWTLLARSHHWKCLPPQLESLEYSLAGSREVNSEQSRSKHTHKYTHTHTHSLHAYQMP